MPSSTAPTRATGLLILVCLAPPHPIAQGTIANSPTCSKPLCLLAQNVLDCLVSIKTFCTSFVFYAKTLDFLALLASSHDLFCLTLRPNNLIYGHNHVLFGERRYDVRENHSMKNATAKKAAAPAKKAAAPAKKAAAPVKAAAPAKKAAAPVKAAAPAKKAAAPVKAAAPAKKAAAPVKAAAPAKKAAAPVKAAAPAKKAAAPAKKAAAPAKKVAAKKS